MNHNEAAFKGVRDIDISWLREGKAKMVILIVHGLGKRSKRSPRGGIGLR
jgi:hypothetical protein